MRIVSIILINRYQSDEFWICAVLFHQKETSVGKETLPFQGIMGNEKNHNESLYKASVHKYRNTFLKPSFSL